MSFAERLDAHQVKRLAPSAGRELILRCNLSIVHSDMTPGDPWTTTSTALSVRQQPSLQPRQYRLVQPPVGYGSDMRGGEGYPMSSRAPIDCMCTVDQLWHGRQCIRLGVNHHARPDAAGQPAFLFQDVCEVLVYLPPGPMPPLVVGTIEVPQRSEGRGLRQWQPVIPTQTYTAPIGACPNLHVCQPTGRDRDGRPSVFCRPFVPRLANNDRGRGRGRGNDRGRGRGRGGNNAAAIVEAINLRIRNLRLHDIEEIDLDYEQVDVEYSAPLGSKLEDISVTASVSTDVYNADGLKVAIDGIEVCRWQGDQAACVPDRRVDIAPSSVLQVFGSLRVLRGATSAAVLMLSMLSDGGDRG